jgi:alkyl hydroperoxide reductase subunit AhpC
MIKIGEKTPSFDGVVAYYRGDFKKISLEDYKKKWLVLFFYPRDFTFVCPTEIEEFGRMEKEFENCNCLILACSTDSEWSHKNFFESDQRLKHIRYPVLADTNHEISRSYDVLVSDGSAQRGTFIIDPESVLRWVNVSDSSVGRSVKEVFRSLKALQTGELCPVEWSPGDKTLRENKGHSRKKSQA